MGYIQLSFSYRILELEIIRLTVVCWIKQIIIKCLKIRVQILELFQDIKNSIYLDLGIIILKVCDYVYYL